MNRTLKASLTTGLIWAWISAVFALSSGAIWLQSSHSGKTSGFYDPDMPGYLLVLTGLLPIAPLIASTVGLSLGLYDLARRTARVVICAIPTSIFLGCLLAKTLAWLDLQGIM